MKVVNYIRVKQNTNTKTNYRIVYNGT